MKINFLKIRIVSIFLLLIIAAAIFCISWSAYIPPIELAKTELGKPVVSDSPVRQNLTILQIISTDDRIYILRDSRCIVSAYTTEGEYLYTIYAFSHPNGRPHIAVNREVMQLNKSIGYDTKLPNDRLYLHDKQGNIYVFEDGSFIDFIPDNQESSELYGLNFDEQSEEFILKGASIYRLDATGNDELVIFRPFWLIFTRGGIAELSILGLIILSGVLSFVGKKNGNDVITFVGKKGGKNIISQLYESGYFDNL